MKYFEVRFQISPDTDTASDILNALLADVGFEAFESIEGGVAAWVQQSVFDPASLDAVIGAFPLPDTVIIYSVAEAPDENWNQQWEQDGFQPIIIWDGENDGAKALVSIHDTSHTDVPEARYDIRINPCQAFGTGSHQTTRMILSQLSGMSVKGRYVVDAGTGTGILAIMCRMLGASRVFAYDIDDWSVRNAQANLQLNGVAQGVEVVLGDSRVLQAGQGGGDSVGAQDERPTLLIANINRNILLADIPVFASVLPVDGELLLSGFFTEDAPILISEASRYGFSPVLQKQDDNWCLLLLKKGKSS